MLRSDPWELFLLLFIIIIIIIITVFKLYSYLLLAQAEEPAKLDDDWLDNLNPQSCITLSGALASAPVAAAKLGSRCATSQSHVT